MLLSGLKPSRHNYMAYLKMKAQERGIQIIDTKIVDTKRKATGDIESLLTNDGRNIAFDFYVDCSGFRSLLLGNAMGVTFQDYKSSLFTDTAIVGNTQHNGTIKPYTEARTMNSGWQWNIPMHREDHLGYVFSATFCSESSAESEFRTLNPPVD